MKHAGVDALNAIEPLLQKLRLLEGPTEKKRGVFYLKGKAFLHFHEDVSGCYADVRFPGDPAFIKHRVSTVAERTRFLVLAKNKLKS